MSEDLSDVPNRMEILIRIANFPDGQKVWLNGVVINLGVPSPVDPKSLVGGLLQAIGCVVNGAMPSQEEKKLNLLLVQHGQVSAN